MSERQEKGPTLIAERVMGLVYHDDDGTWRDGVRGKFACLDEDLPRFSTDIAAAWLVVEKLREAGVFLMLEDHPMCHLSPPHRFSAYFQTRIETVGEGWGDTAALAICRAALVVPADGPR